MAISILMLTKATAQSPTRLPPIEVGSNAEAERPTLQTLLHHVNWQSTPEAPIDLIDDAQSSADDSSAALDALEPPVVSEPAATSLPDSDDVVFATDAAELSQEFQTTAYERESRGELQNNFVAQPDFAGGISIISGDVAMKIGGYVKADLIQDYNPIDSPDSFVTTAIPTDGESGKRARFHARQSRLSFDTRWRIEDRIARAYIEGDFFGGTTDSTVSLYRLRHAYGNIGRFTAGQTWTTFTDPSAVPQTLDFEGGVSNVNRRQGLVRWDQPINNRWSVAVSVENPRVDFITPVLVTGEARTETPDFISRIRYERDRTEFQVAYLMREIGFQPEDAPLIKSFASGFNFSGSAVFHEDTKVYSQIMFGDGIGSYRGSPDVVATGPSTASLLPVFGWMIGAHHRLTERWTTNFTYSALYLDDIAGQASTNLRNTTYFAVNLIANPYERVFCGIEYLYGQRTDVSGAAGHANRVQMSFGFFLP
ncbi:DcaP family trimeric outer membrane transporter [Allorhodopirellula solitaria]|nr:DcaP family trimeric outer membrane transporter [Allorhodopirellula solitaria]